MCPQCYLNIWWLLRRFFCRSFKIQFIFGKPSDNAARKKRLSQNLHYFWHWFFARRGKANQMPRVGNLDGASWFRNSCGNCLNSKIATLAFRRRQIVAMHECVRIWATRLCPKIQDPTRWQTQFYFVAAAALSAAHQWEGKYMRTLSETLNFQEFMFSEKKYIYFCKQSIWNNLWSRVSRIKVHYWFNI